MKYFLLTCLCLMFIPAYGQNAQGIIPISRQVSWSNAGLLPDTPTQADHVFDVTDPTYGAILNDGQNDFNAVYLAIMAARNETGLSVIYFPSGTYNINSQIELTQLDNNIVFQGEGSNTTLIFTVGNTRCFYIHGYQTETVSYLTSSISKGSKDLYGNDINTSSFHVNDWIRLCEYNHGGIESWAQGCVGQINQLTSVQTNHAQMKYEASIYYSQPNGLRFWKIEPVQNVGIEKLKIYRNETQSYGNGTNIYFQYAVNCWIEGVESNNTARNHVEVEYSSHVEISGCYFHHAKSYGNSGYGYGVDLHYSTTNCLVENNIFNNLRHAMLVQAGANSNVFGYNYSINQVWDCGGLCPDGYGPDICIHGNYPYANLFEGNSVVLIFADAAHGNNGPYNTFFRNMTHDERESYLWNSNYANFIGNANSQGLDHDCDETDEELKNLFKQWSVSPSTNVMDIYTNYYETYPGAPTPLTHSDWALILKNPWMAELYINNSFLDDASYYHTSQPAFLDGYEWPTLGPWIRLHAIPDNWVIPAQDRYNNGNYTYIASPTIKLYSYTFKNNFVGISNGGIMKINDTQYTLPTTSFPVLDNTTIKAEAINGQTFNNITYTFHHWSNGSTTRTSTFLATGGDVSLTYTAYFIGKPSRVQNLHNDGAVGAPVHLVWNVHPNASCNYQIWRKVKDNKTGITTGPDLLATLNHGTTSYTDPLYIKTSTYVRYLLSYDARAYYTVEQTTADSYYHVLYGDVGLAKADSTGNQDSELVSSPAAYRIWNYPEPFNPVTTIRYELPQSENVIIKVYDMMGREIKVLVNSFKPAGQHQIEFDGRALSSGFYIYTIQAGSFTAAKKTLLIK